MISYAVKKQKITLLFFTMVVIIGIFSYFQLPKQEMPDIIVNTATVTTVYPGASPEKIENTVTKILENEINGIQGLKSITSRSSLGVSFIIIEANDGEVPKEKWDELRKKVKDAERELPPEAKQPIINDDLNKTFVQSFNISAPTRESLYTLREMVTEWRDEFRTIPGVSGVEIFGLPEKEVRIELDPNKLNHYGLRWGQVLAAIQNENEKTPLGDFEINERSFQLSLPDTYPIEALSQVIVSQNQQGAPIYVRDIGTVSYTTAQETYIAYHNGKPAISINITGEMGTDVPSVQKRIDEVVPTLASTVPSYATVDSLYSQNDRVNELFGELGKEMAIAIGAVLLVCTLGLALSSAFVVALAIPISLAIGMILLPLLGVTLNQITIIGLIIVLGILVDDAVVVNDNIERRLRVLGESPLTASVMGAKEVSISIITATFATIASFAPLLFLQGNVGMFIKPIPIVISLTMIASMIMSLTIIPIFRNWRETRLQAKQQNEEGVRPEKVGVLGKAINKLTIWYGKRVMGTIIKRPILVSIVGVLIGTSAYALIPLIPVQLFPNDDRLEMLVNVKVPVGYSLQETDETVQELTDWIMDHEYVEKVASYAGGAAPKLFSGDTGMSTGIEVGQLAVFLKKDTVTPEEIVEPWTKELQTAFPNSQITPKVLEAGPPVGKPIDVRLYGSDIETLRQLSKEVKQAIASIPGTYDIADDFGVDRYSLEFSINKEMMDKELVSYSDLTKTLRLVSGGLSISQYDDGDDLVDMNLYVQKDEANPMSVFEQLTVPNALGEQIPVSSLVTITPGFSIQAIHHRDLSRVATITGEISGRTAPEVTKELQPLLGEIVFPVGYSWSIGGESSEQVDIFIDLGKLSIVVLFLIVILIALQFYSLSLPFLIMSTVYLGFAGSLIGLFLTQIPLGFMTMMGAISLSGIVVRNGIVLIEFIEEARREGVSLPEAVRKAGEARLRPIILTSTTAVAGLTPLALSGDPLFQPLAVTIISGLIFSTGMTLILVPSLYMVLSRWKERKMKVEAEVEMTTEA